MENRTLWIIGIYFFIAICFSKIFKKANKPEIIAYIPILNILSFLSLIKKPWWWLIMYIIPGINVIWIVWSINLLGKKFGKSWEFTYAFLFLPIVLLPLLAFGKSKYGTVYQDDVDEINVTQSQKSVSQQFDKSVDKVVPQNIISFPVKVLNKNIHTSETLTRIVSADSMSLFRDAILSISNTSYELKSVSQYGEEAKIGQLKVSENMEFKYKLNAVKPSMQFVKPFVGGFSGGIVISLLQIFGKKDYSINLTADLILKMLGISIALGIFLVILDIVFSSSGKKLSIVIIENNKKETIEFAMDKNNFDLLSNYISKNKMKTAEIK